MKKMILAILAAGILPPSTHNIDCKIDGFGAMQLHSEFVKKR